MSVGTVDLGMNVMMPTVLFKLFMLLELLVVGCNEHWLIEDISNNT